MIHRRCTISNEQVGATGLKVGPLLLRAPAHQVRLPSFTTSQMGASGNAESIPLKLESTQKYSDQIVVAHFAGITQLHDADGGKQIRMKRVSTGR